MAALPEASELELKSSFFSFFLFEIILVESGQSLNQYLFYNFVCM